MPAAPRCKPARRNTTCWCLGSPRGRAWGNEQQPKLVSVKLVPEEQVLQKGQSQQLLLKAVFSDGAEKDVTRSALYQSSEGKVAAVEGSGKVKAEGYGESVISSATCGRRR